LGQVRVGLHYRLPKRGATRVSRRGRCSSPRRRRCPTAGRPPQRGRPPPRLAATWGSPRRGRLVQRAWGLASSTSPTARTSTGVDCQVGCVSFLP